jgi:aryl-alcohol dehydrogenase-like predicted oxidoreductase
VIEKLAFGSAGHESTRTLFGAAALGEATQEEADRALEQLLAHGVNHIDTAASYGDAELRIGPWLREHRGDFFLATKTGEREYAPARQQIRRSLELLQTDRVDLIQLHNLVDKAEWETALGPGGALEAAIEAREEGLVRFIGVTGHGLDVAQRHRESLERFPFDSVLLPYNWAVMQDERYAADFETLLALCAERGVAVQTIKSNARRLWQTDPHPPGPWYEPLTEQDAIDTAVAWVLGRPGIFLNTPADLTLLPKVLDAAERAGERPGDDEMRALEQREGLENLFAGAIPI